MTWMISCKRWNSSASASPKSTAARMMTATKHSSTILLKKPSMVCSMAGRLNSRSI